MAMTGEPMTPQTAEVMTARGYKPVAHKAKDLTPQILDRADLVITMTLEHRSELARMLPKASKYSFTFDEFARLINFLRTEPEFSAEFKKKPKETREQYLKRAISEAVLLRGMVPVGGDAPISVQSMTTTPTTDINATLQQIAELTASGCDIVRVACPSQDDADVLRIIAKKSPIPVIADIHFQPKYVFQAIEAGCGAVRVNPGNIRQFDDKVGEIAKAAKDAGVSIRIGVNAGSLDPRLLQKYGKATAEALVESAVWEASLFEEHDFHDFKISVKHNDPVVMVRAYELLAERGDWPLHLGVTEAGPAFQGTIKSAVAFGALLSKGIGDTIRVSLSAPPVEEIKVGSKILESLNLRPRKFEIVSCPSCGRAQVDVYKLAEDVTAGLEKMTVPLRVAVMGCVVNGPGEAREADLGVASGNGKGQIFVKGEVIKTVPESEIVQTLIDEANRLAAEMDPALVGSPEVVVAKKD
ncbi:MAG: flavodoxin-dependent (E)-4-hydroxy-3-methylbut-2-enyl-diphosphate synthase [Micrococcales bacterium]|nr:flavodoxin-dependent (E)-4-hydroxy-3-methylbut-2-enyl-diphosphate synthase [Micrococcales bacterium]